MEFKTVQNKEDKALIDFIIRYAHSYDDMLLQMLIDDFSHYKCKKGELVASARSFLNLDKAENDGIKAILNF